MSGGQGGVEGGDGEVTDILRLKDTFIYMAIYEILFVVMYC